jgi:hypothetical protein
MQLGHLDVKGCLLAGELIMALSCPPLGVDLSGVVPFLLLLLVGLLLIRVGLHSWLRCVIRTMTIGMVWRARVLFRTGVVMMGSVEVTTLHHRGPRDPNPHRYQMWRHPHQRTPQVRCIERITRFVPFPQIRHLSPALGGTYLGGQRDQ